MQRRLIKGDCWADVFTEDSFGGRIYRLGAGERAAVNNVGSIIVGPEAVVSVETRSGRQIMKLPQKKLVLDVQELGLPKTVSYLVVTKAELDDWVLVRK